ncbi:MAG: RDD family protein [Pseudomonadota bacterium]
MTAAGHARRTAAFAIDAALAALVALLLALIFGVFETAIAYLEQFRLRVGLVGLAGYLLAHGWFLSQGRSVGKRLLGLVVIAQSDGAPAKLPRMLVRMLPLALVLFLPPVWALAAFAVNLLPAGFGERRALHDYLAGTRVSRLA